MKRYDIVYSVTAHESIECVYNLYENIMKFNSGLECAIIFHVNEFLNSQRYLVPISRGLFFNPIITEKSAFTKSIMLAHLDNYEYFRDIDFDLFCLLASNCMFICQVNYKLLEDTTPKLADNVFEDKKDPSINFDKIEKEWFWPIYEKCLSLVELFRMNKIGAQARGHEGAYFRKDVFGSIYDFCMNNIVGKFDLPDGAGWEEIIIPSLESYFTGSLGTRYCKHFRFDREISNDELIEFVNSSSPQNIVKRVERSMDSKVRRFINSNL